MQIIQHSIKNNLTHLLLDFRTLEEGERVPFNIYIKKDDEYAILVKAGTLLKGRIYKLLQEQSALYILRQDQVKQSLNCTSLERYIQLNKHSNEKITKEFSYLFAENFDAIMHHHERYDGSGYPNHLIKRQISKHDTIT